MKKHSVLKSVFQKWRQNRLNKTGLAVVLGAVCFILSLVPDLFFFVYLSAFLYWLVLLSSLKRLNSRNRIQVILLLSVGVICSGVAFVVKDVAFGDLARVLKANLGITSMLVGVSFLSLLPNSKQSKGDVRKLKGALSTWVSVHLLGAVINLSSVFLVGDRLQRTQPMTDGQLSVIVRALTTAGFWSPFFASMAVAFSVAPSAVYLELLLVGIPVAMVALLFSMWELRRMNQLETFIGFPVSFTSLVFPVFLAAVVLFFHYFVFEALPILSIVTFVCPLSILCLLLVRCGQNKTVRRIEEHVSLRLPNMINEISLFISAGFMSASVSLLINLILGGNWTLFDTFGFWAAYACYIAICLVALAGLHPIVGISLMSALVPFDGVNNTLLAFVCLSAWGVGTAIGPLSGINLSVAGKYQLDNIRLSRLNVRYGLFMSAIVAIAMAVLVQWLNI
ncbi:hypothetical protein [Marinomonas mediterranea]|uniref:Citrate transporter n=1 Tax=Marinomonas mediterranea (strain ATCC 700492 / JCM 21426 / NBRC 103028 / MMB-1) TaxID=717774 RepID=F2K2M7_MARM1|nr:hypothetical protein [Marinomonas mediterranea]ADZ90072.1 hypothetical protein Marme_0789 [Marinomonas mediterranea MMB-1]WCN08136.1 hypothetical protein GV055_03980 [Marinomonas mediterranea]WCN12205.1 hypothetical protein GV054_03885 [Marinomonas mediterranea]WCN16277.1 hypothetical protein GV053_03990 [Marinomonas mediterranea MMB-1]